ncbi:MAG TPA: tRNA (adenosine(37)-N6)-threonylcarbamoyltransferase complex dimerization subunit type 1 TsaB [Allocoleopsis sp.]
MKYGLGIHTSSPELGLVMNNFAADYRRQNWNLGRDLGNYLHDNLSQFILPQKWTDLEYIAVSKGPGSFTGTRIGIVTARTLAQQLNIPVFTISSLAAIVHDQMTENNQIMAISMPAQRQQLFTAIYQKISDESGLKTLLSDTVMSSEKWQETLKNLDFKYDLIEIPAGIGLGETVKNVLELGQKEWEKGERSPWFDALPYYGQSPVNN